ncbi:MAG TPA: lytic murein transglycosylase B [Burkholderiaceae bacterium]|nr:lytic murein transglycosylase B [Burkholderiaceae bacterium]
MKTKILAALLMLTAVAVATDATDADAATRRRNRPPAATSAAAAAAAATAPAIAAVDYSTRDDVRQFIAELVERHGFDADELARAFTQIRADGSVIRLMQPPSAGFKRSWAVYRTRFLDPLRIREGVRFWREHEADIRRASQQYGVPEEIIVGIIGVETIYGRVTGDYRVVDALTILAFDYPRRAAFFRSELEQFLLYTRDSGLAPASVKGSFAGAIGLPQFMPGSIRRYAVDFDGDGRIDLRASPVDAIGSVARFLAEHGWQRGETTRLPALFADETRLRPLVEAGIEPRFTLTELAGYGISSVDGVPGDMKLALIDLPNGDGPVSYYLGTPNFYVITRYNRSSFYAMAVIELGNALRESRAVLSARQ